MRIDELSESRAKLLTVDHFNWHSVKFHKSDTKEKTQKLKKEKILKIKKNNKLKNSII